MATQLNEYHPVPPRGGGYNWQPDEAYRWIDWHWHYCTKMPLAALAEVCRLATLAYGYMPPKCCARHYAAAALARAATAKVEK